GRPSGPIVARVANSPLSRSRCDAGISGMLASYGRGQPEPLAAWISWMFTLRAQLTGSRAAPGSGLQSAGGGPSWTPTAQQARQVSVALMFHVPGWRKVTPPSPLWAMVGAGGDELSPQGLDVA